ADAGADGGGPLGMGIAFGRRVDDLPGQRSPTLAEDVPDERILELLLLFHHALLPGVRLQCGRLIEAVPQPRHPRLFSTRGRLNLAPLRTHVPPSVTGDPPTALALDRAIELVDHPEIEAGPADETL